MITTDDLLHSIEESVFTPSDDWTSGRVSYIRPVYRREQWIGWAVYQSGEALGKVFAPTDYKLAAQLLYRVRSGSLS